MLMHNKQIHIHIFALKMSFEERIQILARIFGQ